MYMHLKRAGSATFHWLTDFAHVFVDFQMKIILGKHLVKWWGEETAGEENME